MMRKFTALAAAIAFAFTTLAPADAGARDRRGYNDHRGHHGRHYRDHDDHDDAVAAGVVGLVIGLVLGAAASEPRAPRCRDNYRRCPPPPDRDGYYEEGGYDPRYDDDRRSAYEQDYGVAPEGSYDPYGAPPPRPECTRQERQWDRYANRYVTVDVAC